jgi:triacylglycerol lipase
MQLTSSFGLDPKIEARFRELGPVFTPDIVPLSRELFAGKADLSFPEGGRRVDNVPYGDHPRQVLDIVSPGSDVGLPIVLFVPGGGMTGGDKAIYAHIPACFARLGFVGVSMNYRLAPEFLFPCGAQDVSAAIDWIHQNIAEYGGDPSKIFIMGQSAGAVHAASSIFDARVHPKALSSVRGAMLMSGVYEITPDHEGGNINLYFGNDAEELKDRSSVNHVAGSTVPVIISFTELEPTFFGLSAAALLKELTRRDRRPPETVWLRGHNHLSPVLNLGGPGDQLGEAIANAFRRFLS